MTIHFTQTLSLASLCLLSATLTACADDPGADDLASETGDTDETGDDDPTTGDGDGDGDGDPTTGDGDGDPSTGDGDPEDTEAPTIASIEPANGAIGVMPDAVITVVFSEPMDKAATQAAYQSADLGPAEVTMAWNDAGDTLTIIPNDPLEVAEGDQTPAITYALSITDVGRDLAGNELDATTSTQFSVVRRLIGQLGFVDSLTGSILQDGTEVPGYLLVGDDSAPNANAQFKMVLTVDLSQVSIDISAWESVTLSVEQSYVNEAPYADLGNLQIEHVSFDSLSDAFAAPGTGLGVFSDSPALGERTFELGDAVAGDFAADQLAQFRLSFDEPTDWDGEGDVAWFDAATLTLQASVLFP